MARKSALAVLFLMVVGSAAAAQLVSPGNTRDDGYERRVTTTESDDACFRKISPAVARVIEDEFPQYRLPRASDQSPDDFENTKQCHLVAEARLTDKAHSIAVVLADDRDSRAHLVAAVGQGERWRIFSLPTWCASVHHCYVDVVEPGTFIRFEGFAGPLAPDESEKIATAHETFISGTPESTGVVYFLDHGHWRYVWVSD
jgi:hypothetical protein